MDNQEADRRIDEYLRKKNRIQETEPKTAADLDDLSRYIYSKLRTEYMLYHLKHLIEAERPKLTRWQRFIQWLKSNTVGHVGRIFSIERRYRLRAECMDDALKLSSLIPDNCKVKWRAYLVHMESPDVEVDVTLTLDLEAFRNVIREVEDGHVMLQTVNYYEKYTGERDYEIK